MARGEESLMALIDWSPSLSVGVGEIDGQHKELVRLTNRLHDAMGRGQPQAVMGGLVDGLARYARTHFATEERLMDRHGYPAVRAHKEEHRAFVQKVVEFKKGLDAGRLTVSLDVLKFLRDWLVRHIKDTDRKYGPFLNAKGVA
jgi:hemerythrin-like metal-binding protein